MLQLLLFFRVLETKQVPIAVVNHHDQTTMELVGNDFQHTGAGSLAMRALESLSIRICNLTAITLGSTCKSIEQP